MYQKKSMTTQAQLLHQLVTNKINSGFRRDANEVVRSSGILRSVEWHFCSIVSGQPIGPIFKGQAFQEENRLTLDTQLHKERCGRWPV
jgi:hypothetical protein